MFYTTDYNYLILEYLLDTYHTVWSTRNPKDYMNKWTVNISNNHSIADKNLLYCWNVSSLLYFLSEHMLDPSDRYTLVQLWTVTINTKKLSLVLRANVFQ